MQHRVSLMIMIVGLSPSTENGIVEFPSAG